jgi:hypothetical protein
MYLLSVRTSVTCIIMNEIAALSKLSNIRIFFSLGGIFITSLINNYRNK